MKEAFGVSMEELQASFDGMLEKKYAGVRAALKKPELKDDASLEELKAAATANPDSFVLQMRLADKLAAEGETAGAIAAAERAAKLLPTANEDNNPNRFIAEVALKAGDKARAARALEDLLQVDHSDVEAARQLVLLVEPLGDAARTERAYRHVVDIDPFDGKVQTSLGRVAMQRKDAGTAVRSFRSALAVNPADRVTVHTDLAEALFASGQRAAAKTETLNALEIAPSYDRALELLLRINAEPK